MGVAFVVSTGHVGQLAHLSGVQSTVRHRHTQHRRVTLNVQAVLQTQRQKLFFRDLARQIALCLALELGDALVQQLLIIVIVNVHMYPVA